MRRRVYELHQLSCVDKWGHKSQLCSASRTGRRAFDNMNIVNQLASSMGAQGLLACRSVSFSGSLTPRINDKEGGRLVSAEMRPHHEGTDSCAAASASVDVTGQGIIALPNTVGVATQPTHDSHCEHPHPDTGQSSTPRRPGRISVKLAEKLVAECS